MELVIVPPAFVCQAWKDGAHKLSEACDKSQGEVTADQLKMMLSRGERTLVAAMDSTGPKGWAAIQTQQLPNVRVLYVYAIYAPGATTPELFEQLAKMAKADGCSEIRGACNEAIQRLWERRFSARKLYTTMAIDI